MCANSCVHLSPIDRHARQHHPRGLQPPSSSIVFHSTTTTSRSHRRRAPRPGRHQYWRPAANRSQPTRRVIINSSNSSSATAVAAPRQSSPATSPGTQPTNGRYQPFVRHQIVYREDSASALNPSEPPANPPQVEAQPQVNISDESGRRSPITDGTEEGPEREPLESEGEEDILILHDDEFLDDGSLPAKA